MTLRANYFTLGAKAMTILIAQESYLKAQFSESSTVTPTVWELVKLRISQLNQCAFCIDMHSKEAIALGETSERIIGLSAWRDMPLYVEIERVALGFAEHLTLEKSLDDQSYSSVVEVLGEQAVVDLTIAINAINSWNRLVKTFKPAVGSLI